MRRGTKRRRNGGVEREWCEVLDVALVDVGVDVTAAASAGATTLVVEDETLFEDEDRGALLVGNQVVDFTAFDVDTLTLTLADPLTADVAVDDTIYLYDRARREIVADLEATVDSDEWGLIDGVTIDDGVADALPPGPRDLGTGEEVLVEYDPDDDEYSIIRTRGLGRARGRKWEDDDTHTPTTAEITAAALTVALSHTGIVDESMEVRINGVVLGAAWYTVDLAAGTVAVTLPPWVTTGETLSFHYEYLQSPSLGLVAPDPLAGLVSRGVTVTSSAGSSMALPAGTQVGDLVVVHACGANSGGKNAALGSGAVTDGRLSGYYGHPSGDTWWGTVTDLSAIQIATVASGWACVATFGDTGGGTPLVASGAVGVTKTEAAGNALDTITLPSTPRVGVVACLTHDTGSTIASPTPTGFTSIAAGAGSSVSEMRVVWWTGTAPSPSYAWTDSSSSQRYDRTLVTLPVIIEGQDG